MDDGQTSTMNSRLANSDLATNLKMEVFMISLDVCLNRSTEFENKLSIYNILKGYEPSVLLR